MILYCSIIHYNYKQLQEYLLGQTCSGTATINEVYYHELKDTYRVDAAFTPAETTDTMRIQLFLKERPSFEPNDQIHIEQISFKEPQSESYKKYLLKESIHATAFSQKLIYTLQAKNVSHAQLLKNKLHQLEERIYKKLSKNSQILFGSLFLGSKRYLESTDLKNHFNTWGINHFLARSGLHVSIIIFLILFISRLCQLTFFASTIMTSLSLIFYISFSYSSISFFRALASSFFMLWGLAFKVPVNLLHILLISLMLFILYNPFYVFFLDFQLTFLLTLALCVTTLINSEA